MAKQRDERIPRQRAAVDAIRARWHTPEARAEEARIRAAVEAEFPPAEADPDTRAAGAALRARREALGLSLDDAAAASGLDRATISRIENGRVANPTVGTLRRLAHALGAEVHLAIESPATQPGHRAQ